MVITLIGLKRQYIYAQLDYLMDTTVVTIKRVNKFDTEKTSSCSLVVAEPVKGFVLNKDTKAFEEAEVTQLSFGSWELEKVLCSVNDDVDYLRAMLGHAFNQSTFVGILYKAKLTIHRELHHAGDVIEGKDMPLTRDCYITSIVDVTLSDKGQTFVDAMIDSLMTKSINA